MSRLWVCHSTQYREGGIPSRHLAGNHRPEFPSLCLPKGKGCLLAGDLRHKSDHSTTREVGKIDSAATSRAMIMT